MYTCAIKVRNPVGSTEREIVFQFDPATFDETVWAKGYPLVAQDIQALQSLAAEADPVVWASDSAKMNDQLTKATATAAPAEVAIAVGP